MQQEYQRREERDDEGVIFTGFTKDRVSQKNGKPYRSCGGQAMVSGVKYLITGFERVTKDGKTYFNLVFKKADEEMAESRRKYTEPEPERGTPVEDIAW